MWQNCFSGNFAHCADFDLSLGMSVATLEYVWHIHPLVKHEDEYARIQIPLKWIIFFSLPSAFCIFYLSPPLLLIYSKLCGSYHASKWRTSFSFIKKTSANPCLGRTIDTVQFTLFACSDFIAQSNLVCTTYDAVSFTLFTKFFKRYTDAGLCGFRIFVSSSFLQS